MASLWYKLPLGIYKLRYAPIDNDIGIELCALYSRYITASWHSISLRLPTLAEKSKVYSTMNHRRITRV